MSLSLLGARDAPVVTTLLAEAFLDYPAMRFVLGPIPRYAEQLESLIGFFVSARILREDLLLGVTDASGQLVAAALVTLPGDREPPMELSRLRESLWRELGEGARARYEAFGVAAGQFVVTAPHHHLNMIGVRPGHLGQGHARTLLEHIHHLAEADPRSSGVTLTTERRENLPLYERFGYRRNGEVQIAPALVTWGFYRPC